MFNAYQSVNAPRHVVEAKGADSVGDGRLLDSDWLLTDGRGGYAAGTALGVNTRRYHGLLVAASRPPVGRVVCLNQVLEQLVLSAPSLDSQAKGGSTPMLSQTIDLSTLIFQDGEGRRLYVPDGYTRLRRFEKGLGVHWHYQWGQVTVSRDLWLHWKPDPGSGAVTLRYRIGGLGPLLSQTGAGAMLRLGPLVSARDFHSLLHQFDSGPVHAHCRMAKAGPVVSVERGPWTLTFQAARPSDEGGHAEPITFREDTDWWYAIQYPVDARRGQEDREDHFLPGHFEIPLSVEDDSENAVAETTLTAALGTAPVEPVIGAKQRATHLQPIAERLITPASTWARTDPSKAKSDAWTLAQASDDFLVDRWVSRQAGVGSRAGNHGVAGKRLSTIIAGYPWFADWGRDTFISLPGLLLSTGRYDEARAVLHAFAHALGTGPNRGLIANRFDDYDASHTAAHYNTVDASLWFIHAALQYVDAAGDRQSLAGWLGQACITIVDSYIHGTGDAGKDRASESGQSRLIQMAGDALISAGRSDTQLTWMDAAAHAPGDPNLSVFTPRPGKAVEINALWHHVLRGLSRALPQRFDDKKDHYTKLANRVQRSFAKTFWNEAQGGLFDCVVGHGDEADKDASIRPNQIFAAALADSPLANQRKRQVIALVKRKLLTPVGLRSLSEDDPNFHGLYAGSQFQRDAAYHQGTIWPWLIGPYAEAVLRSDRFSQRATTEAREAVQPLFNFLLEPTRANQSPGHQGFGQLYEIHQAQSQNHIKPPRGCFAQAWSVAELIRLLDLLAQ